MTLFSDPVFLVVLIGVVMVTVASSAVGCLLYVQRNALLGETMAHGCLPGIYAAFLLGGTRNLGWLALGATLSGLVSSLLVDAIVARTRIHHDAAMAIVLSWMFGTGVVLLSFIQQANLSNQNGLEDLFFGNAAAMSWNDVMIITGVSAVVGVLMGINFRRIKIYLFDAEYARMQGVKITWVRALLSSLVAMSVAIGIQTAGAILMASLLVAPAATARQWTSRLLPMVCVALAVGVLGGTIGTVLSCASPNMPTGPWVVISMTLLFALSIAAQRVSGRLKSSQKR
ncbi:MAG: ABC transporter [Crocinitomicaceae bacterium]|nr:ABC transporter [Crocinitomicaceae bacterium]